MACRSIRPWSPPVNSIAPSPTPRLAAGSPTPLLQAGSTPSLPATIKLPPVLIFFFAQRLFIQGLVVSGLKG